MVEQGLWPGYRTSMDFTWQNQSQLVLGAHILTEGLEPDRSFEEDGRP